MVSVGAAHGPSRTRRAWAASGSATPADPGIDALDARRDAEARGVVGPLALHHLVARRRQGPPLGPFLEGGLGVPALGVGGLGRGGEGALHHGAGGLVARVEEDRAEDRLADVGEDGRVAPAAGLRRAAAQPHVRGDLPGLGHSRAALAAHQRREAAREVALVGPRARPEEPVGDGEAEHAVAQELQALVALPPVRRAHVGEGLREQVRVREAVADARLERVDVGRGPAHRRHVSRIHPTRQAPSGSCGRGGSSAPSRATPTGATRRRPRRWRRR